jgi:hypothetical protein
MIASTRMSKKSATSTYFETVRNLPHLCRRHRCWPGRRGRQVARIARQASHLKYLSGEVRGLSRRIAGLDETAERLGQIGPQLRARLWILRRLSKRGRIQQDQNHQREHHCGRTTLSNPWTTSTQSSKRPPSTSNATHPSPRSPTSPSQSDMEAVLAGDTHQPELTTGGGVCKYIHNVDLSAVGGIESSGYGCKTCRGLTRSASLLTTLTGRACPRNRHAVGLRVDDDLTGCIA